MFKASPLLSEGDQEILGVLDVDVSRIFMNDINDQLFDLINDEYRAFVTLFFDTLDNYPELFWVTDRFVVLDKPTKVRNVDLGSYSFVNIANNAENRGFDRYETFSAVSNRLQRNRRFNGELKVRGLFELASPQTLPDEVLTKYHAYRSIREGSLFEIPQCYNYHVLRVKEYDYLLAFQYVVPRTITSFTVNLIDISDEDKSEIIEGIMTANTDVIQRAGNIENTIVISYVKPTFISTVYNNFQ
jgi:hypothetical protein